ncbi:MAG: hypothetical protein PQJ50_04255, partial [Spirochaetales bacterium]|nr:hypothetical protein [Spirochaetales bacterium]
GDEGERFQLWRPGLFWPSEAEVIEILIPLPGIDAGRILVSIAELPEGDLPSAVLASAVSRTLWSLITMLEKEFAMAASTVHYRKPRTYSVPETQDFAEVLPGRWKKVSCYYLWDGNAEDYNELFRKALEAGVLLPPSPAYPCIIPGELTSGDLAALKKIL